MAQRVPKWNDIFPPVTPRAGRLVDDERTRCAELRRANVDPGGDPTSINDPSGYAAQFDYAPDRSRWRQGSTYSGATETTVYLGGLLELAEFVIRYL